MNPQELIIDADETDDRPRKQRKKAEDRRVFVYRVVDGKPKEQGSFPETTIGAPLERRLPMFLRDVFGAGEYMVQPRKHNGQFEQTFDFTIAETSEPRSPIQPPAVESEAETVREGPRELSFEQNTGQMSGVEVENLLLKERLRRMEEDVARHKTGNQTEMQTLISALEESRREQRELMMMMLNRSQQPQQDSTAQAMNILEKSLGIVTKAKAISEEIAPYGDSGGGGGGMLADGAKLIDSLGRNAGTFLPMLMGAGSLMSRPQLPNSPAPRTPAPQQTADAAAGVGELSELAKKIQQKEGDKK
jgi:hypothetical protein